jgi:sulfide dehydrogenase cytochrome subunit
MDISLLSPAALGCAILLVASTPTSAAEPGRLLASQCAQCHGTNGAGSGFDELAGKGASELFNELIEMKYRPVEGIMDRQARGYTDDQLQQIADYLSTLPGNGSD